MDHEGRETGGRPVEPENARGHSVGEDRQITGGHGTVCRIWGDEKPICNYHRMKTLKDINKNIFKVKNNYVDRDKRM